MDVSTLDRAIPTHADEIGLLAIIAMYRNVGDRPDKEKSPEAFASPGIPTLSRSV